MLAAIVSPTSPMLGRCLTFGAGVAVAVGAGVGAGVGIGVFESVEKAVENLALDRVYESQGVNYDECYRRYLAYDKILNVTD